VTSEQPPSEQPDYKGAPLDADRGPGLGCFWAQLVVFVILFVLTPVGVINGWPAGLTMAMMVGTLVLALFVGQTVIFLLRLVSADRRSRRRLLRSGAGATVGDLAETTPEPDSPTDDAAAESPADAEPDAPGDPTSVRQ
jgi:hypothetical protein